MRRQWKLDFLLFAWFDFFRVVVYSFKKKGELFVLLHITDGRNPRTMNEIYNNQEITEKLVVCFFNLSDSKFHLTRCLQFVCVCVCVFAFLCACACIFFSYGKSVICHLFYLAKLFE